MSWSLKAVSFYLSGSVTFSARPWVWVAVTVRVTKWGSSCWSARACWRSSVRFAESGMIRERLPMQRERESSSWLYLFRCDLKRESQVNAGDATNCNGAFRILLGVG